MSIVQSENASRSLSDIEEDLVSVVRRLDRTAEGLEASAAYEERRLPGNAWFLPNGAILCGPRSTGDSRYPYGSGGFTLWAHASGRISANHGPFFWLLPAGETQESPLATFVGSRSADERSFASHAITTAPVVPSSEESVIRRFAVLGPDAAYYVLSTRRLLAALRIVVEAGSGSAPCLRFSTYVENRTEQRLDVFTSFYANPHCRHALSVSDEDRWFKRVSIDSQSKREQTHRCDERGRLPSFLIETNEDLNRFESIANRHHVERGFQIGQQPSGQLAVDTRDAEQPRGSASASLRDQPTTSWIDFFGSQARTLSTAHFLETGVLDTAKSLTTFTENAVVGDLISCELPPANYLRVEHVWSEAASTDGAAPLPTHPIDLCRASDRAAHQVREQSNFNHGATLCVEESRSSEFCAKHFNHFVPHLQHQVAVCTRLRGYMQRAENSLIGFRDVMQAAEGRLYDNPVEARAAIVEALEYVLVDGRCPRQFLPAARGKAALADLREFVDQGAWAISTVCTYVRVTGDRSILEEVVGYHRIEEGSTGRLLPETQQDRVVDHLVKIGNYLRRQLDRATGLVRALYGDWNDAIDGLGLPAGRQSGFGDGVSVMASLQLYENCEQLVELLRIAGSTGHAQTIEDYRSARDELRDNLLRHAVAKRGGERRVLHGWGDLQSFEVGGFEDVDGHARDGLTSNAFWVLSGMLDADPSMKSHILEAFDRLDSRYGLRTFTPGFGPQASAVGRINKLPIGAAENGAVYVHATAFGIAALFRMGQPQLAWEQIVKVLPFTPVHRTLSHSPFVMPNSYVDNVELGLDGESMNDWQTGSSNVIWKTLVRYVAGFDPRVDHLRVAPAAWAPFDTLAFEGVAHERRVRIERAVAAVSERRFTIDGADAGASAFDQELGTSVLEVPFDQLDRDSVTTIRVIDPISRDG